MTDKEIRSILAPLTDGYILLPNSAVGEILNFTSPEPFKQGPAWLLGEIAWRGWQVPVINYEQAASIAAEYGWNEMPEYAERRQRHEDYIESPYFDCQDPG